MSLRLPFLLLLPLLLPIALLADEWKLDAIHLKNKDRFDGLIVEEGKDAVRFKYVVRKPGARTLVFPTTFTKAEIERIDRLSEAERKTLELRLSEIQGRVDREAARMAALKLESIPWPGNGRGLEYSGRYFVLVSNAREDLVRRVVVRLEEIFEAFGRYLAPRRQPEARTRVVFYKTVEEYTQAVQGMGLNILNPAYYDLQKNQIVAASGLEQLAEKLEELRQKHEALLGEVRAQEKKLREHFKGRPPANLLNQLYQVRRRIEFLNNENECAFDRQNTRLFTTLYHEAFHAYLDNYVLPGRQAPVPHWLNEGLAQIFETALVETGALRVGHVDADRLTRVKDAVRQKQMVSLRDLLATEPKDFFADHRSDAQASNRHFLAAWALAYYLTFECKVLAGDALDHYVRGLGRGADRLQAFQDLVGQPLDPFEAKFQQFILNLRTDGVPAK